MKPLLEKGDLDNWNGYFDNDNVQTLFLDGIVMHIMVGNGEIHFVYNEISSSNIYYEIIYKKLFGGFLNK